MSFDQPDSSLGHMSSSANPPFPGNGPISGRAWSSWTQVVLATMTAGLLLSSIVGLQHNLDQRNGQMTRVEELRLLPRGEVMKPALLGYHHLGADVIWLRIIQVIGEQKASAKDYEWLAHALDVLTTLDPQYVYAYEAGGTVLTELAGRIDLSNQLLEKGIHANPLAWRLPFFLAYNYFFYLDDYVRAADYMSQAARLPGRPAFVPELAARLYVEGRNPTFALRYLEAMIRETQEEQGRAVLENRYKEVLVEWHIQVLDRAVQQYVEKAGTPPPTLHDLVTQGLLTDLPKEPFDGEYQLDRTTGHVTSTTHPERMRLYRPADAIKFQKKS